MTEKDKAAHLPRAAGGMISIYGALSGELRRALTAEYQPGERLPSERKLAQEYHVSPVTVSRAMQELSRDGIVYRVPGRGTFLGNGVAPGHAAKDGQNNFGGESNFSGDTDRETPGAASAVAAVTGIIAPIGGTETVHQDPYTWTHQAVSAIERGVQQAGGRTFLIDMETVESAQVAASLEGLIAQGVNNFVAVMAGNELNDPWMVALMRMQLKAKGNIPVVLVSASFPSRWPFDSVRYDGSLGVFQATLHLLEHGHRSIAFIAPPFPYPWVPERIDGFHRALLLWGLEPSEADIIVPEVPVQTSGYAWEDVRHTGYEQFFADGRYTAAVAANDHLAIGLMNAAEARGLHAPQDFSVIGFDDLAEGGQRRLTTVHPPYDQVGGEAGRQARRRLAGGPIRGRVETALAPSLLVRDSTGPVPPKHQSRAK